MNFPPQGNDTSGAASIILPGATGGPLYLTKNGAGAPPYSFAGDTNCGIDSSGADTIDLVCSGSSKVQVSSSGIKILATTNPILTGGTSINGGDTLTVSGATGYAYVSSYGYVDTNANASIGAVPLGTGVVLGSGSLFAWSNNANATAGALDIGLSRKAAGILQLNTGVADAGAALEFLEQTAPSAPAANGCRLYCVDAAGKTQLRALFNSGTSQLIAAEP